MPQPPRHPFVAPSIPRPIGVVVCLASDNAVAIVRQLGRVIRGIDRSLPDIEHDPQVAFLADFGRTHEPLRDSQGRDLPMDAPRLYVFERQALTRDPSASALYENLKDEPGIVPRAIRTTKSSFFNSSRESAHSSK